MIIFQKQIYDNAQFRNETLSKRDHRIITYLNLHSNASLIGVYAGKGYAKASVIQSYLAVRDVDAIWMDLAITPEGSCSFLAELQSHFMILDESLREHAPWDLQQAQEYISAYNKELCLVLNNCQEMSSDEDANLLLERLLSLPFSTIRVILIGCSAPSFSLSSLKSQGRYLEINDSLLEYTLEETEDFFNMLHSCDLEHYEIVAIHHAMEGWPCGYQIILQYLEHNQHSRQPHVTRNIHLNITSISEYLDHEVFKAESPQMQDFLLRTSLLKNLRPSIIEQYLGIQGSDYLQELMERNIFVTRTNDGTLCYRRFFRTFLYQRYCELDYADVVKSHTILSDIYGRHFHYLPALAHAIASDDYKQTTRLMQIIETRYDTFQLFDIIDGHLEEISTPSIIPGAILFLARFIPENILVEFVAPLERMLAEPYISDNPVRTLDLQIRLSTIQYHFGRIDKATEILEPAIENALTLQDYPMASYALQLIAACHLKKGDEKKAFHDVRQALYYAEKYENRYMQIHTLEAFCLICLETGNLQQASEYIDLALDLVKSSVYTQFWIFAAKSQVQCHLGDTDGAVMWAQKAQDIVKNGNSEYDLAYSYLIMANAYLKSGDDAQAEAFFDQAYQHSYYCGWLRYQTILGQIQLYEKRGDAQKKADKEKECIAHCREYGYIIALNESAESAEEAKAGLPAETDTKTENDEMLTITTLGAFSMSVNGVPVTVKRSVSLRLLFYLIINRQRSVNRDEIAEEIMPDRAYDNYNYFNVALSSLRKSIEAALPPGRSSDYILRADNRYQLHPQKVVIDTDCFHALYANIDHCSIDDLLRMEQYYKGDFLEEYPYETFLFNDREQLSWQYINVLHRIALYYESQEDYDKCIEYYDRLLAKEPYSDEIYREYLRFLLETSAYSKARKTAQKMLYYIESELNVPCQKDLEKLFGEYGVSFKA